jgi:hypothetical protein
MEPTDDQVKLDYIYSVCQKIDAFMEAMAPMMNMFSSDNIPALPGDLLKNLMS